MKLTNTTRSVICAALMLLAAGCADDEPVQFMRATVTKQPLVYHGVYRGDLKAKNSVAIHVPKVADAWQLTVDSVLPDGSHVEKGDVILTFVRDTLELDLRDETDKLEVAKAERRKEAESLARERVELQLEVDRKKLAVERAKLAVVKGVNFISKIDLDKAKLDLKKAKLELKLAKQALHEFEKKRATSLHVQNLKVEAAQRAVDLKKDGLQQVDVKAPVSGVLYAPYTRLNWQHTKVEPGVVARPGDKILEIPDLSAYQAEIHVRPRDAAFLDVGDEATVYPTIMPDHPIRAKIVEKDDFATTRNERTGTDDPAGTLKEHTVVLDLDEAPEALRPGNTARVEIASTLVDDALVIPLVAVHEAPDGGSYVVRADGHEQAVKLGKSTLTEAQVLDGLKQGDQLRVAGPAPAATHGADAGTP